MSAVETLLDEVAGLVANAGGSARPLRGDTRTWRVVTPGTRTIVWTPETDVSIRGVVLCNLSNAVCISRNGLTTNDVTNMVDGQSIGHEILLWNTQSLGAADAFFRMFGLNFWVKPSEGQSLSMYYSTASGNGYIGIHYDYLPHI